MRASGRAADEMRSVSLERGASKHAEGSCLVRFGDTHVLCAASVEDRLPPWLRGGGKGWVTAEYGMLPRSTGERMRREATQGKQGGRTLEIQRLIGRSLRAVVDLKALGERALYVDCDVLQADGGTRTASITGAYVALACACNRLVDAGLLERPGDRLAATVYDDGIDANRLDENDIACHAAAHGRVGRVHETAAVLDDKRLPPKPLHVRQRFQKSGRFVNELIH